METLKKPILLAQCKAFHTVEDVSREIESLLKIHSPRALDIHISLPYSFIDPIREKFPESEFKPGAEVMLDTTEGSFTASIAGKMLEDAKVAFTLIGTPQDYLSHAHSLKNNVTTALKSNVQPFICIGETLQEHQDKASKDVLLTQLKSHLEHLTPEELKNIYIIYNAEWISRTPWEAASPELHDAYQTFRDVVNEATGEGAILPSQLIVAIPAYSEDLPALIKSLQAQPSPFHGYSVGILGSSAEYLKPILVEQNPKSEPPQPETKPAPDDKPESDEPSDAAAPSETTEPEQVVIKRKPGRPKKTTETTETTDSENAETK